MIKFDVINRFSGEVKFTAEIDCKDDDPLSLKLGLAVRWAVKNKVSLTEADLTEANLTEANLTRANLTGVDMTRAKLTEADLTRANLKWADLTGVDMTRADLTGVDMTWAKLTRANLTEADLKWADLTRANLTGVDLTGVDMTRADLTEADLKSANLILFKGFGSSAGTLQAHKLKTGGIQITTGCYTGLIDDFVEKVKITHGYNKHAKDYLLICDLIKQRFGD